MPFHYPALGRVGFEPTTNASALQMGATHYKLCHLSYRPFLFIYTEFWWFCSFYLSEIYFKQSLKTCNVEILCPSGLFFLTKLLASKFWLLSISYLLLSTSCTKMIINTILLYNNGYQKECS